MRRSFFISLVCLFTFLSCENLPFYTRFQPVNPEGWQRGDTLFFVLPEVVSDTVVEVELYGRITDAYPDKDLHLNVELYADSSFKKSFSPVLMFFDDNGNMLKSSVNYGESKCHIGKMPLKKGVKYELRVMHNMYKPIVTGATDIGVCIGLSERIRKKIVSD